MDLKETIFVVSKIVYEDKNSIITFEYQDVIDKLYMIYTTPEDQVKNDLENIFILFKWLQVNPNRGREDIKINSGDKQQQAKLLSLINYVLNGLISDQISHSHGLSKISIP